MFDRSRSHILVRTPDTRAVLAQMDGQLRRWGFRRRSAVPAGYRGAGSQELRELFHRADGDWTTLANEDIENTFETAFALSRQMRETPILASRAYQYGEWQLKAYHDKDCLLKVGDDGDLEMKWPAPRLDPERFGAITSVLGGGATLELFLRNAMAGRPDPRDLREALGLPDLSVAFADLRAGPTEGWTYALWVHEDSPLWRG